MGSPTQPQASGHLYAIGTRRAPAKPAAPSTPASPAASTDPVAQLQVFPYESLLNPGDKQTFTLKLYDAKGNFIRQEPATAAQWSLDLLQGTVEPDGTYVAPPAGSAGFVKATIGTVSSQARVRVMPSLPIAVDFEGLKATPMWWTANGKATPGVIEGAGVLVRPRDDTDWPLNGLHKDTPECADCDPKRVFADTSRNCGDNACHG